MVEGIDKSMVHPENAALLSTKKKLATKPQKDKQKPKCILLSERILCHSYRMTSVKSSSMETYDPQLSEVSQGMMDEFAKHK